MNSIIRFFLENKFIVFLLLIVIISWGIITAPFKWDLDWLPSDPVPVDAIPNYGETQQIVFTSWPGRSPQDIEDQVTYPLTTYLLGVPGVKTIRSTTMFGFSSIYIILDDDIDFYWSRARILEKLNALPKGLLPEGVQPALGPDATGLGQIYWYTLEGRDPDGNPTGGWDLHELRTIQDFYIKYALAATEGVSEIASIGGHVKEYQIDVNPAAMRGNNVSLREIANSIRNSNIDIGARTIEMNRIEYFVRGLGYIKSIEDIENSVVAVRENVPVRIKDIGKVNIGPAERRGALGKGGTEVVGGVVTVRHGENPMQVIENVKAKIADIAPGLPSRILDDGTVSQLQLIPFYDRTELIQETIGTLEHAISLQILITIVVIIVMLFNMRASLFVSGLLPMAVLMCFIMMKYTGVDANIVALSGIAIAIGTIVDMGIIMSENMVLHLNEADKKEPKIEVIYRACVEVAPAILTAVATTIISFLPVFTLQAAEGKLFTPLAYTKTFALIAAIFVTIVVIPAVAHILFSVTINMKRIRLAANYILIAAGLYIAIAHFPFAGIIMILFGANNLIEELTDLFESKLHTVFTIIISVFFVGILLAESWLPLGPERSLFFNIIFVFLIIGSVLGFFMLFMRFYTAILKWCLANKALFLTLPSLSILLGLMIWLGFGNVFGIVANGFEKIGVNIRTTIVWHSMYSTFPGTSKEFMPKLDEGSFLLMPIVMPHAGIEESLEILKHLDKVVQSVPEVELVVGKIGRVESALDPAPIGMYENVVNYKSEYKLDERGRRMRFASDREGNFIRDEKGELIPDKRGKYFRQWREHIRSPRDIWEEVASISRFPGLTSASMLQPIETRLVMLQTGTRAKMAMLVQGPDLQTIEAFSLELEKHIQDVPGVNAPTVFADRVVGKPYLEIDIDRKAIARHGLSVRDVQDYIEIAVGGMTLTTTVEGRERYPVRVRYAREFRENPHEIERILVSTPSGANIPLNQLAELKYVQGPQAIKTENTFLAAYVIFDALEGFSAIDVVENADNYINALIQSGELLVPDGVTFRFVGDYENQQRAEKRLAIVIPLSLLIILLILYLQFRSLTTSLMIFTAIAVAFSGGFMMLWLYGQDWFLNFSLFGTHFQELFRINPVNLSVAVWVGFLALFGIATDDGVVMATYLKQSFARNQPDSLEQIRQSVVEAGNRRVRPCLMTTATTLLALLPILTSTGKGSDIMIPMAIPAFGGMTIVIMTLFVIPVLYSLWQEKMLKKKNKN